MDITQAKEISAVFQRSTGSISSRLLLLGVTND